MKKLSCGDNGENYSVTCNLESLCYFMLIVTLVLSLAKYVSYKVKKCDGRTADIYFTD